MSATTCPSCGKPLRPGAKFCGNCGATLPAAPPPRPAAAAGPTPAGATPANMVPCPHCGKPVRPETKFCSNCGKTIEPAAAEKLAATQIEPAIAASPGKAPTLQGPPPASPAAPTMQGRPGATGESPRPAGARPIPPPPAAAPRPRRRGLALALLAVLLVVCVLAAGGIYLAATRLDPVRGLLGLEGTITAPAVTVALTSTVTQTPAQATITTTQTSVVTPTLTATPTATITPTVALPSPAVTPTLGLALGASPTTMATDGAPFAAAPIPAVLIEDTFNGPLSTNWIAWGSPTATIDSGFNDRWLSLKAEDPKAGGVTTGQAFRILNGPGTSIEFEGQLDNRYLNFAIVMNWDQETFRRNEGTLQQGVIHVEVRSEAISVTTPLTNSACQAAVDASKSHIYRIDILEGQALALFIDGIATPCTIPDMGLAPLPGRLSFSGLGWITRVKIMQRP